MESFRGPHRLAPSTASRRPSTRRAHHDVSERSEARRRAALRSRRRRRTRFSSSVVRMHRRRRQAAIGVHAHASADAPVARPGGRSASAAEALPHPSTVQWPTGRPARVGTRDARCASAGSATRAAAEEKGARRIERHGRSWAWRWVRAAPSVCASAAGVRRLRDVGGSRRDRGGSRRETSRVAPRRNVDPGRIDRRVSVSQQDDDS